MIRLVREVKPSIESSVILRQVIRSSTSVGANYRAACRSRSAAEKIAKLSIVLEEADETMYWLEVGAEVEIFETMAIDHLYRECNEVVAMTVASLKTLRANHPQKNVVREEIRDWSDED
ncbi:MAG: four helix bundle protein [Fimbriimonadaceae bacterium]|nr:four helix bundle protein [Fimbriimonadaceae bacterium]